MLDNILFAIWFLLPAAVANMVPILAANAPLLKHFDAPIDSGRTWRGKELLGSHKTWRGIISGIIAATLVLWIQQILVANNSWIADIIPVSLDFATLPTLVLGPLFALGALGGDAAESFLKRQRGIKSGGSWVPFDQIDYIIGAIIVTLPFIILPVAVYVWMLLIWCVIHLLASYIGWLLHLKDDPI